MRVGSLPRPAQLLAAPPNTSAPRALFTIPCRCLAHAPLPRLRLGPCFCCAASFSESAAASFSICSIFSSVTDLSGMIFGLARICRRGERQGGEGQGVRRPESGEQAECFSLGDRTSQ